MCALSTIRYDMNIMRYDVHSFPPHSRLLVAYPLNYVLWTFDILRISHTHQFFVLVFFALIFDQLRLR